MSSFSMEETLLTFLTLDTEHFVLLAYSLLYITIDETLQTSCQYYVLLTGCSELDPYERFVSW